MDIRIRVAKCVGLPLDRFITLCYNNFKGVIMKIIRAGTPETMRIFEGECIHCHTQVEFYQHEGKVTYDQKEGDYITVVCPICGKNIYADYRKPKVS